MRSSAHLLGIVLCASACNVLLDNQEVMLRGSDAAAERRDAASTREPDGGSMDARDAEADGRDAAFDAAEAATPVCAPNEVQRDKVACGPCDRGTRARMRACRDGGRWGEWEFTAECDEAAIECLPGEVEELASVACGPCAAGAATLKRECVAEECRWTVPALEVAECRLPEDHCEPGEVKRVSVEPCGACGKGSIVQMRACAGDCRWAAITTSACVYLENACDPQGPTRFRCKPPRDPDTNQAYRESCFAEDYGEDADPTAQAIRCTYGSDNREPCSESECPECY